VKRREFISLLVGAAAACPLAARAQQSGRMRRIGVLMTRNAEDPEEQARLTAFLQSLQEWGWSDGRNVRIDVRWSGADPDRRRRYAAELVALAPDVILADTSTVVAALQQATQIVPIVFAGVIDPVGAGFVVSLARPGGNTTGFASLDYSYCVTNLGVCCEQRSMGNARASLPERPPISVASLQSSSERGVQAADPLGW
jgi:putative tryptophan/tyrosine transport system substrate-binding protein